MEVLNIEDNNGKKALNITAFWSEVAADYNDIVSAYSNVQVPGFRPGKVPRSVIESRLQRKILEEFSQRVAQRLGREALSHANIETIGPVEISDIECRKGKLFRFNALFWPMPEIELPDLRSLAVGDDGSDPRDLISKRLLELVRFDVPNELVRVELGDDDGNSGDIAWKAASDRVRLILILKRIAGREGIEVSDADVEQRIREKAIEFGEDADSLRRELQEGGVQRLKDMLIAEGTLTYLMELHQQR